MTLPRSFRSRQLPVVRVPKMLNVNPNLVRVRHRGFARFSGKVPQAFLIHYFTVLQIHKPRLLLPVANRRDDLLSTD